MLSVYIKLNGARNIGYTAYFYVNFVSVAFSFIPPFVSYAKIMASAISLNKFSSVFCISLRCSLFFGQRFRNRFSTDIFFSIILIGIVTSLKMRAAYSLLFYHKHIINSTLSNKIFPSKYANPISCNCVICPDGNIPMKWN